ncbi:DUF7115 domain-containing protein [Haloarchaeobius sp. DFWS5]|uniref:DUF7115 domain-containing protein n=1 Tax=Haloarchaeobius sp. DFWS5 TaxID=3446114 RepID=UPI003EBBC909
MDVPGIVEATLGGEDVAAEVSLGGENVLYVTPTRTLIYQSEGFLSDESVDEYPHDAERMTIKEGRRKTRITLEYSLEGEKDFTVPANVTERVVHPVLAGVLNASGVTDAGETVSRTFRFSELTLIITSERLVKHVGSAVWDEDYEEYHYADLTSLDFEPGSVATQVVMRVDGRPERIKIANDRAAEVEEYLKQALFAYYDVSSLAALNEAVKPDEEEADERPNPVDFGEGVDPLDAGNTVQPESELPENSQRDSPAQAREPAQGEQAASDQPQARQRDTEPAQAPKSGRTPEPETEQTPESGRVAGTEQTTDAPQRPDGRDPQSRDQSDSQARDRLSNQPAAGQTQPRQSTGDQQGRPRDDRSQERQPAHESATREAAPQTDEYAASGEAHSDQQPTSASHETAPEPASAAAESTETEPRRETAREQQPEPEAEQASAPSSERPTATEAGHASGAAAELDADDEGFETVDEAVTEAPEGDDETVSVADERFAKAGFEPAMDTDDEILERLDDLESTVERQNDLLKRQQRLIQQLVDGLKNQ